MILNSSSFLFKRSFREEAKSRDKSVAIDVPFEVAYLFGTPRIIGWP
jgi:hypothetical protein